MGKKADRRKRARPTRQAKTEAFPDSDANFAYIVGYTSGGMPYGMTHEEMEHAIKWEKNHPPQEFSDMEHPWAGETEETEETEHTEEIVESKPPETNTWEPGEPFQDLPF